MKKIISIFTFSILALSISYAQERGPRQQRSPEEMAKMQTERLTKELELSKPQQDSVYKYALITSLEQQKLFSNTGNNREESMKTMQSLREKQNEKFKSFFNSEQLKKYEELSKQRGPGNQGGGPRGTRPNN